jgi:DNA transformation protein and related proteins
MKRKSSTSSFETFVVDQLSSLGNVTSRKMFGGVGLYSDDLFFGLIARDQLYLKVDDRTRRSFEEAGCTPFRPFLDRPGTMKYYSVPLEVLESAPALVEWAGRAVAAAARANDAKTSKRRQKP